MRNERPTKSLKPHPLNADIYGDGCDSELKESIAKHGILNPLLITQDDLIIAGHRRHNAAQMLQLETVPVIVSALIDDLDIQEAIIETNRQREKTNDQRRKEGEKLKQIEEARAKRRMEAGKNQHSPVENFPQAEGKSRDIAAEKVGWSGKTLDKALKVGKKIEEYKKGGETEKAEELTETLNNSVDGAYKKIKAEEKPKKQKNGGEKRETKEERDVRLRQLMSSDFKRNFEAFYEEVQNAKMEKWRATSKEAALHCVKLLNDLITI